MKELLQISIKPICSAVSPPEYAYPGDAGFDLKSTIKRALAPSERFIFSCGFAIEIPEGFAGLVLPRSGLASKFGITVINSPGLVDSGYRGEIKVICDNLSKDSPIIIKKGDKIAQLMIIQHETADFVVVDKLSDSERGIGGFGSTGYANVESVPENS